MTSTEKWDAIVVGAGLGGLTAAGTGWDPLLASKRMSRKPSTAATDKVEVVA